MIKHKENGDQALNKGLELGSGAAGAGGDRDGGRQEQGRGAGDSVATSRAPPGKSEKLGVAGTCHVHHYSPAVNTGQPPCRALLVPLFLNVTWKLCFWGGEVQLLRFLSSLKVCRRLEASYTGTLGYELIVSNVITAFYLGTTGRR